MTLCIDQSCGKFENCSQQQASSWQTSLKLPEANTESSSMFNTGMLTPSYQDTYFHTQNSYDNNFYSNRYLDDGDFCTFDDLVLPTKINFQEFHTLSTMVGFENFSERVLTQSEKSAKQSAICDLGKEEAAASNKERERNRIPSRD